MKGRNTGLDPLSSPPKGGALLPTGPVIDKIIQDALNRGLKIYGRRIANGIHQEIPSRDFAWLEFQYVPDGLRDRETGNLLWDRLLFDREDMRRLWPGGDNGVVPTRRATRDEIRAAVRAEYEAVQRSGGKPPNVNECRRAVYEALKAQRLKATHEEIEGVVDEAEFADLRLRQGEHPG